MTNQSQAIHVLLTTQQFPPNRIGSWTGMLASVLGPSDTYFDFVITPKSNIEGLGSKHLEPKKIANLQVVSHKTLNRLGLREAALRIRFKNFNGHLSKVFEDNKRVVLSIVDDYKLLEAVDSYLDRRGLRNRVRIIFYLHGHDYGFEPDKRNAFYKRIDRLVLLTESSYQHQIDRVLSLECKVSILRNGVDETRFNRVDELDTIEIRRELGWSSDKKYLLWVSVDRPKKGFSVLKQAWKEVSSYRKDLQLVAIGLENTDSLPNIISLGPIPNYQLPKYYQASDFYLFPTLWHEGHPLSLTEALRCGTTCISSKIDPIPEIMSFGKFGRLVDVPHDPNSWVSAIQEELERYQVNGCRNPYLENIPEDIYSLSSWKTGLRQILKSVADSFEA